MATTTPIKPLGKYVMAVPGFIARPFGYGIVIARNVNSKTYSDVKQQGRTPSQASSNPSVLIPRGDNQSHRDNITIRRFDRKFTRSKRPIDNSRSLRARTRTSHSTATRVAELSKPRLATH